MGDRIELTGAFSHDGRWAQLTDNGWVFMSQIKTDIKTPKSAKSIPKSVPSEDVFLKRTSFPIGKHRLETYTYGEYVPSTGLMPSPGLYGYRGFPPLSVLRPVCLWPRIRLP